MYTVFNKAKSPDENGALASAHWRAATNNATWNEVTPNSGLVNAPSWLATRCLQLKLSESTNVFKAGMSSGMLVFIDMFTWRHHADWEAGKDVIFFSGAAVEFTSPNSVPDPVESGHLCSVGQSCLYGVSKKKIARLGDDSGTSPWGDCTDKIPYSMADCVKKCLWPHYRPCLNRTDGEDRASCYSKAVVEHRSGCLCYPPCNDEQWDASASSWALKMETLTTAIIPGTNQGD